MYAIKNTHTGAYLRKGRLDDYESYATRAEASFRIRQLDLNRNCYKVVWIELKDIKREKGVRNDD